MKLKIIFTVLAVFFLLYALAIQFANHSMGQQTKTNTAEPGIMFEEDIVYGRIHGESILADIAYMVNDLETALPVIISVHGGRWFSGHKKDPSTINVQQWARFGFFAISIDYRLVGSTPAPACYQDLQCAIRWVHSHAEQFNIDTDRIYLIGQSAGGHMVSLAATLGDGPYQRTGGWEDSSNEFAAAISVAASYELTTLSWGDIWTPESGDPIEARKLASPVNHVRQDMKPLCIIHSDNDHSVPIENALGMVRALKETGVEHVFHRYPSAGHMGITTEVIKRSLEFIEEVETK